MYIYSRLYKSINPQDTNQEVPCQPHPDQCSFFTLSLQCLSLSPKEMVRKLGNMYSSVGVKEAGYPGLLLNTSVTPGSSSPLYDWGVLSLML